VKPLAPSVSPGPHLPSDWLDELVLDMNLQASSAASQEDQSLLAGL